jgi:hypothetical protein
MISSLGFNHFRTSSRLFLRLLAVIVRTCSWA